MRHRRIAIGVARVDLDEHGNGTGVTEAMQLGVRTWGNSSSGSTTMVTGSYTTDGEVSRRLLDALPTMIVIERQSRDTPLVQLLADEIGTDAPGPPMSFLATWRLGLAADLLREPGATVITVSRSVGYQSPFTFSTAFKRAYGVSPSAHRDAGRSSGRSSVQSSGESSSATVNGSDNGLEWSQSASSERNAVSRTSG